MLDRLKQLAGQRRNFAFETTLSTRSYLPWLASLQDCGYAVDLVFLWLPDPEIAIARVIERVRLGGHDVPEAVIRRRYRRGLHNFFRLYRPLAHRWWLLDNSGPNGVRLLACGTHSAVDIIDEGIWNNLVERFR